MEQSNECTVRVRETPRGEEEVKALIIRLNRIMGQIGGIKRMIEENRYCGDILTQVSAAGSAIRSFGYLVLEEHMRTCVSEKIKADDPEIVHETVELIRQFR